MGLKQTIDGKLTIKMLPSKDELWRVLDYDPESGILLWKARPREDFQTHKSWLTWNRRYAGTLAINSLHSSGYLCGHLFGVTTKAHRVIWKMMTGSDAKIIDHDDGNKSNNKWLNLKDGSTADNMKNKKLYESNKSGVSGVYWSKDGQKWHAQIRVDGVKKHLGFFSSLEEAKEARVKAESAFGYNVNHGRKTN